MRAVMVVLGLLTGGCEFVVEGLPADGGVASDLSALDGPPAIDQATSDQPMDFAQAPPDFALPSVHSCSDVLQATPGAPSGVYAISQGGTALSVYCDMTDDGGGWTLVLRTVYDFTQTQTLIDGYAGFYGSTLGSTDAGKAYRLAAQYWPALNATGGHLIVHTVRGTDTKDCGRLAFRGTGATWAVPAPPGPATIGAVSASVNIFSNTVLSTNDTGPAQGCVTSLSAVPWPYSGCCDTCPSYGMGGMGHPGFDYPGTLDLNGNSAESICKPGVEFGDGLAHDNAFEYYVR